MSESVTESVNGVVESAPEADVPEVPVNTIPGAFVADCGNIHATHVPGGPLDGVVMVDAKGNVSR